MKTTVITQYSNAMDVILIKQHRILIEVSQSHAKLIEFNPTQFTK